jgi:hypothetical protein
MARPSNTTPLTFEEAYQLLTSGLPRKRVDAVFAHLVGVWTWRAAGKHWDDDLILLENGARRMRFTVHVEDAKRYMRNTAVVRERLQLLDDDESLMNFDAALAALTLEGLP